MSVIQKQAADLGRIVRVAQAFSGKTKWEQLHPRYRDPNPRNRATFNNMITSYYEDRPECQR
jgi:hypothetical protein